MGERISSSPARAVASRTAERLRSSSHRVARDSAQRDLPLRWPPRMSSCAAAVIASESLGVEANADPRLPAEALVVACGFDVAVGGIEELRFQLPLSRKTPAGAQVE